MNDYVKKNNIPYQECGKLIVAVEERELDELQVLFDRGVANGVKDLKIIEKDEITKMEPNCVGLRAIHSPHTAIVDYNLVAKSFADDFQKEGGKVHLNFKLTKFELNETDDYPVSLISDNGEQIKSKFVITAAGLFSDKIAQLTGKF